MVEKNRITSFIVVKHEINVLTFSRAFEFCQFSFKRKVSSHPYRLHDGKSISKKKKRVLKRDQRR